MDLYDQPCQKPPSQYEIVVLKKETPAVNQYAKSQVFSYMDKLEGWCSTSKASVLMDLVFMLKPETVVEIGVWGGKSLVPMAYALKVNEKGKAYGIDPWSNFESSEGMDGVNFNWWMSVDHELIMRGLQKRVLEFSLQDQIQLIQASSELAQPIPNIDILHIDGNHSEKASYTDVTKWVPLVKKGGVVIFDDMTWGTNGKAVEWLDENCIKFAQFAEDSDWGIWVKP